MRLPTCGVGLLGIGLTLLFATAEVCGQTDATGDVYSRVPSMALTRDAQKQEMFSAQAQWLDFKSRNGDGWKALWRESTGTPHRVYGGSVKLLSPGALTRSSVADACDQFIRSNSDLLKAAAEDLTLAKVVDVRGKWGVIFRQQYQGIEVYGGRVDFRIAGDGTLLYFGSDFYPGIEVAVVPTISSEEAVVQARAIFTGAVGEGWCDAEDLVIFPTEQSSAVEYHLAYRVRVRTSEPLGEWVVFVDANSGEALWTYNQIKTGTISGTFHGHIHPLYETDTTVDEPFEYQAVYLDDVDAIVFQDTAQTPSNWYIIQPPWGTAYCNGCDESDHSWDESGGFPYAPDMDASLTSKNIYPGESDKVPVLTFCNRYSLAWAPYDEPDHDFCNVEVRPSGESEWKLVRRYTGEGQNSAKNVNLTDLLTDDSMQIRFRFKSNAYDQGSGWNIDDVFVRYRSTGLTDSQGRFSFESDSQQTVSAELEGPGAEVIRYGETSAHIAHLANPGVPLDLSWDPYATVHERNLYYHMTRALRHIGAIDMPLLLQLTRRPVPAMVDLPTSTDNAYWDPTWGGIGFCSRLALYADVIYHEYAHMVTDKLYEYWKPLDDMNEGFSDYWACTLTGDSIVGEQGGLDHPRYLENDLRFPDDFKFHERFIHENGQIISGAMWDTRQNLIASLGYSSGVRCADALFHFARYYEPFDFEDFLFDVLFLDEDDSDPDNGTPNMAEITDAFGRHGIGPEDDVEVKGYQISEETLVDNGEQIGDADGVVDPGEHGTLLVTLRNFGLSLTNVVVRLQCESCEVLEETRSYGDMPTGASALPQSGQPFRFQVPKDGLSIGMTLEFQLLISADGGYSHTAYIRSNIGEAPVLVVDDMPLWFRQYTTPEDLMFIYEQSLNRLGINYAEWRVQEYGIPSVEELQKYGCVIWYTGYDRAVCVSDAEADTLSAFLDSSPGAALFITGQDIGTTAYYDVYGSGMWANPGSQEFYRDYLKAELLADTPSYPFVNSLDGVSGDPIGDGLSLEIDDDCDDGCAKYTKMPDVIAVRDTIPLPSPVFTYNNNGGTAAIRWEDDDKLVYMAFGFEAINESAMRDTVMARVLDWLAPGIGTRGVGELATDGPFCPGGDGGNTLTLHISARNEHGARKAHVGIRLSYFYGTSEGFAEMPQLTAQNCRLTSPAAVTDDLGNADIETKRLGGCGKFGYDVVDLSHNIVIYRGNSPWIKSYDIDQGPSCQIDDTDVEWFPLYEGHQHPCADFDGDGVVGPQDSTLLVGHLGHYSVCAEHSSIDLTQSQSCLVMCPGGDLSKPPPYAAQEFTVEHSLRNVWDSPLEGIPADSIVCFIPEPAPDWYSGENYQFVCNEDNTAVPADGPTGSEGRTSTTVMRAAGYGIGTAVTAAVSDGDPQGMVNIGEADISPKSPDIDASGRVDWADVMVYSLDRQQGNNHHRSDMNCDRLVDDKDLLFINAHYGCRCASLKQSGSKGEGDQSQWPADVAKTIRSAVPNEVLDRWLTYELHPDLRRLLEYVRGLPQPTGTSQDLAGRPQAMLVPEVTAMFQNYPNPVTVGTTIRYQVAVPGGMVRILVFDVAGRLVRTLVDKETTPGFYSVSWDGRTDKGEHVQNGIYFFQMKAPGFVSSKRMMLMR